MRALVVDDDRSWMEIIREILEDCGLSVDTADNLLAALAYVEQPHRLAVIDLALNERDHRNQDGLKILQELRRRDPGCGVVLLTGYATVELAVNAIKQYGASDVLRKEIFNRGELRRLVLQTLAAQRQPGAQAAVDRPAPPTGAVQARNDDKSGTILVVEDDPSWQDILVEVLGDSGYQVRTCSSFGEALGCLRREHFRLAIVDLSLSRASNAGLAGRGRPENLEGYRLLAGIKAADTPVIVLSGLTDPGLIEQAFNQQHVFAFLEKQAFNRRVFSQTVQEALEREGGNPELDLLTEREREVMDLTGERLNQQGNCGQPGDHHQHGEAPPQVDFRQTGYPHSLRSRRKSKRGIVLFTQ